MTKYALKRTLAPICIAVVAVFSAHMPTGAVAEEQRWAVFIEAAAPSGNAYVISWNYSDVVKAVEAAINLCAERTGIPCAPRRLLPSDIYFPDRILFFSTSASFEDGRELFEDYVWEYKARCVLVYTSPGNWRYGVLHGNSEDHVRRKFAKRQRDNDENYVDPVPLVLKELVCNDW